MNKYRGECEITIGGKVRPMLFNMHSYAIASEGMKLGIEEFQDALQDHRQTRAFMWLVYAALEAGAEYKGIELDFTYFDIGEWLMDVEQGELNKAIKTIEASSETNLPKTSKPTANKKK